MRKILENLKEGLKPYIFFFEEWCNNGNCNLNIDDVTLINYYKSHDFKDLIRKQLDYNREVDLIISVTSKLQRGLQVFKEFVVLNFFEKVISLATQYGFDEFLRTPIKNLCINEFVKNSFLKLKCHTLQFAFIIYKPEEFTRGWLYQVISEIQSSIKSCQTPFLIRPILKNNVETSILIEN